MGARAMLDTETEMSATPAIGVFEEGTGSGMSRSSVGSYTGALGSEISLASARVASSGNMHRIGNDLVTVESRPWNRGALIVVDGSVDDASGVVHTM